MRTSMDDRLRFFPFYQPQGKNWTLLLARRSGCLAGVVLAAVGLLCLPHCRGARRSDGRMTPVLPKCLSLALSLPGRAPPPNDRCVIHRSSGSIAIKQGKHLRSLFFLPTFLFYSQRMMISLPPQSYRCRQAAHDEWPST